MTGTSWLDREIFTSTLAANQTGWDWLSLQLDDGRDLMLYRLRDARRARGLRPRHPGRRRRQDQQPAGRAVGAVAAGKLAKPRHRRRNTPWPGACRFPPQGIDLELRAVMPEQENVSPLTGIHYWEGAVIAAPRGAKPGTGNLGRGFVELTGYGKDSRPPV